MAAMCKRELVAAMCKRELVAAMCKLEVRARVGNTVNEYLKLCFNTNRSSSSIIKCMLLETTFLQAN